ncbi:MAG: bifunctional phosphoserine phosphatase/homoserine phosphotransferase ThrH [bacterium]
MVIITDLEGVLVPEIWTEIARLTGIEELGLTTHDEPDFGRLMARRVELLRQHDLRLPELRRIADDVMPFPGATELLAWYRTKAQVMIASDTFHELSEGLVQRMGGWNLFANTFRTDDDGRIEGYRLRIRGRKDRIIAALKDIGFRIIAVGDGWNDEGMFRVAHHPILFNAPEALIERIPNGSVAENYTDLQAIVSDICVRVARGEFEELPTG